MDANWPCICGHIMENHDFDQVAQIYTACFVRSHITEDVGEYLKHHQFGYADDCGQFEHIPTLDWIERKYEERILS